MSDFRFIVADTETTDATPSAGVCEVAYAEIDENFNIIREHTSLVDPEKPISASASGIHGIADEDVVDSPTLDEYMFVVHETPPFMGKVVFIAHNAQFDLRYLGKYIDEHAGTICTLRLARRFLPNAENHKLQSLMYELKLPRRESHRADSDVFTTIGLLKHISEVSGVSLRDMVAETEKFIKVETMPFGKHKGTPLVALTSSYRKWLLELDNLDPDLKQSLLLLK
ncbi:exonuclease domain-containing protein [Methylotenera sp.]|uniref:exonuclease domain-containing protein n=1 Tax=Methylotenera sp. TaxID=2051956 RepID=UPI00248A7939|nr:exonuclease domain-containing protein [Methylotenera sp.]MDI1360634.1 exonuclease domain-containing protein [Methylotenera sp.]